jgi:hypothetical protein
MTEKTDLSELIERVEKATGPDRELDAAIAVAMLGTTATEDDLIYHKVPAHDDHCARGTYWRKSRSGWSLHTSATFSASLDSALALVEEMLPGANWSLGYFPEKPSYAAEVWYSTVHYGLSGSPATAILLALLRALQSQPSQVDA